MYPASTNDSLVLRGNGEHHAMGTKFHSNLCLERITNAAIGQQSLF
jgi:hypothetical protein